MKWIAITGSWRQSNPALRHDVQKAVADIMIRGDGIVTGGALGVDYAATVEALIHNPEADRIRIIIPTSLDVYAAHYRKRASEGVISHTQAEELIDLLYTVKQRRALSMVEMSHSVANQETYYDRNTKVLADADMLLAFQVNDSQGTQDANDKAHTLGLPVHIKQYHIEECSK